MHKGQLTLTLTPTNSYQERKLSRQPSTFLRSPKAYRKGEALNITHTMTTRDERTKIYEDTLSIYPKILEGVKKSGVKRFLVVGGARSLFVSPGLRLIDSGALPDAYMPGVKSLALFFLEILSNGASLLTRVFFSPAGIMEPGIRTNKFRLGKDDLIVNEKGESKISVQDYAVAMIDELENPAHHRERFTIGY